MTSVAVGQRAPSFRLPSAQGPEVGLDDYLGRQNLILLFAKGMACGFCRQTMSQLARGYEKFRALAAEILEITPTPPERARFYAKNFQLPFPYLCDPDYAVYRAYGLDLRPHSIAWYAKAMYRGVTTPKPETEFGPAKPTLGEMPKLVKDDDLGFFILDQQGLVRFAQGAPYAMLEGGKMVARQIPSNDEIARQLERCQAQEGYRPA